MNLLPLIGLLLYTFGAYAFGYVLVYSAWSRRRAPAGPGGCRPAGEPLNLPSLAILACSFLWFVTLLLQILFSLSPGLPREPLWVARIVLSYLFPPLLMHVMHAEHRAGSPQIDRRRWSWPIAPMYVVCAAGAAWGVLGYQGRLGLPPAVVGTAVSLGFAGLFGLAGLYSVALVQKARRRDESSRERSSRRSMVLLFSATILLTAMITLVVLTGASFGRIVNLVGSCLPLAFILVTVYHDNRFEFFDLFIKRGAALLLTIALLTAYFGLVLPALAGLELDWARPWVYAVILLPVALSLPWFYARLGRLLDHLWLGRRYTPAEAIQGFLGDLGEATTEAGLVRRAERGLERIFQAPARVRLGPGQAPPAEFGCVLDVPVRLHGQPAGAILMGRRSSQAPYFSEDAALLQSLAGMFASMLDNVRLQRRKREQDNLARELSLQASRSELKALRAQINPHFLFNALNAIAGLIHRDPSRADRTVEKLAEVFRYTLRRSENEWARLEDELEFVRSYLEVEQARFGRRLEFEVRVQDGLGSLRIPAMLLQTLVENAVKHGIAARRAGGRIEIAAWSDGEELRLDVADNGPGPSPAAGPSAGEGYGLSNVRLRLAGHFGERASLGFDRDAARGRTVVGLRLPVERLAAEDGAAARAGRRGGSASR